MTKKPQLEDSVAKNEAAASKSGERTTAARGDRRAAILSARAEAASHIFFRTDAAAHIFFGA